MYMYVHVPPVQCLFMYMYIMSFALVVSADIYIMLRDGQPVTDDEIVGMLIGLLLAGQHTSSSTTAWLGFFLAKHKDLQVNGSGWAFIYLQYIFLFMWSSMSNSAAICIRFYMYH